jgi:hypothetical protein
VKMTDFGDGGYVTRKRKFKVKLNTHVASRRSRRLREIRMDKEKLVIYFRKLFRKTHKQEISFKCIKHEKISRHMGADFSNNLFKN